MGREKGLKEGILMNQFATMEDFHFSVLHYNVLMNASINGGADAKTCRFGEASA